MNPQSVKSRSVRVATKRPGTAQLEVIERASHFPWKDAPDLYWPLLIEFVTATAAEAN